MHTGAPSGGLNLAAASAAVVMMIAASALCMHKSILEVWSQPLGEVRL